MTTIVTRAGKGSPLTNAEVDANFTNLNTAKLEASNNLSDLASAATARTNLGVAIGTNVQAWDADLDAIAALAGTSGFLKKTAANTWSLDTSTYLTGNQTITFTGDATGSGATSVALTLANSGVTAGTYTKVTVDAKGRVTTGASLASADVTTALGFTPYNSTNPSGYITAASPALTGTPTAPTAAVGTSTTQLATTAFVNAEIANDAPTKTGGGASGTWGISITGNAATVTNGVYTTGDQTIDGVKTFRGAASTDAYMYLSAVNGIAVFQIAGSGTNSSFLLFANSTNNERSRITVDNGRNLYISNNSGTTNHFTFGSTGNLTATGNIAANSDERLKKDWATLSDDFVDRLAQLKHGTYTRIDTGERQAGASAQEWQQLLPEVVLTNEGGTLSLAYGNAALVSAIQLAQQLVHTRNRVAQLEDKLAKIAGEG